ncbi:MAG: MamK family actin-like protein [Desulfobulbaceae bacterium]|nr:MamK family actin-like protein [Desulfobulbaceae bacterium]
MTETQNEEIEVEDVEVEEVEEVVAEKVSRAPGHILVGIDLGTCRTVIMSNQNKKSLVRSVAGYAKDIISKGVVGDEPLFGDDAVSKRNFLDLCFPLADGVIREASERDYLAATQLLEHVVSLVRDNEGVEVSGIIGVPARASMMNKELLLGIAQNIMKTALVVSEPFMVAYFLGKLSDCIVVDIGGGTIDICAMKGELPSAEDQVTIFKAGDHIDERLASAISRRYPSAQVTKSVACKIKEAHAFVGEPVSPVRVTLRADGKPVEFDVTSEIRMVCESIVPDIVEQLQMLIQRFDPEVQEITLQNIILAGGGSRISGLDAMIAEQMREYGRVKVTCVDDPDYIGAGGALKLATDVPAEQWKHIGVMFGS